MLLEEDLEQLVDDTFPHALWTEYEAHGAGVYALYILDIEYRYTEWLCSLSLDGRWTLSPRAGPWEDYRTVTER